MASADASTGHVLGRRWEASALLKSGLGVQTFRGRDLRGGGPVIVKQTRAADLLPGAQLRLEHEAEVLRDVAGAGLVPLLDVGQDDDVFYLVTPFARVESTAMCRLV